MTATVAVVLGLREEEVEVGEQGAGVGDKEPAKGQDGADEAFLRFRLAQKNGTSSVRTRKRGGEVAYIDQRVDAAVLDHRPCSLRSLEV